jgi:hypothetical protein
MRKFISIALASFAAITLSLPACASDDKARAAATEKEKVDKEKEQAAKKRAEQAKDQGSASSGQTAAPPPGGTDLGLEAEKEEAKIRAGGSATSQSR